MKIKNMENDGKNYIPGSKENSQHCSIMTDKIIVRGDGLTIDDIVRVARLGVGVCLTEEEEILQRINKSHDFIMQAVESNQSIYGVTTVFGGMSNISVSKEDAEALQNNIPWSHKSGAGKKLPKVDVRASMLLRANSLMRGASGVRLEIIQRLVDFLNADITPHLYELGSIGASGDLVPLSYILGVIIGLDPSFSVDMKGKKIDSISALKFLNLPRLRLLPKEGLAMINGTSVMSAIAANCTYDAQILLALAMGAHALFIQGLCASKQSFHPYVNTLKPHPGQIWTSKQMLNLLNGSRLIREELNGKHRQCNNGLEQDRYSLRCLPQYMGPIVDGLSIIRKQVEVEINSATDNPLIDADNKVYYYCGNFLGQYIGVSMDQLRYYLGLLAKHLDAATQFSTHARMSLDVHKVFTDPQYSDTIVKKFGSDVIKNLRETIKFIYNPQGDFLSWGDSWVRKHRKLSTAFILGGQVRTAMKQPFSAPGGAFDIGWKNVWKYSIRCWTIYKDN